MAFIHINNKSDFQLLLKARAGKTFPDCAFTLVFQTVGEFRYEVKSDDTMRFVPNAARTEAVVTFDFRDGNYFPNGQLLCTIKADMPNGMFPDGYENTQTPMLLNIVIWDGASDYADAVAVDFVLPYVVAGNANTPIVFDTSNILRKRIPFGAKPYQLYYTDFVRCPNAGAEQGVFDSKVPKWLSEFLKEYLTSREGATLPDKLGVYAVNVDFCDPKKHSIGTIFYNDEVGKYDDFITPEDVDFDNLDKKNIYFEVPRGVYYFDANRTFRRYCNADEYRPTRRVKLYTQPPSYNSNHTNHGTVILLDSDTIEHQCYVRRRCNNENGKGHWFHYWRKTKRLRSLNNAPVKQAWDMNKARWQHCFVRIRSIPKNNLHGAKSEWLYWKVQAKYTINNYHHTLLLLITPARPQ